MFGWNLTTLLTAEFLHWRLFSSFYWCQQTHLPGGVQLIFSVFWWDSESVLCQYWVWWYKHSKFQYPHKFWSYLGEERETYLTTFLPLPFHLPSSGKETLNQFCHRKAVLYFNLFFPLLIPPQRSTSSWRGRRTLQLHSPGIKKMLKHTRRRRTGK